MVEVASAYVPLSRVQQLTDLIILRDFDVTALRVNPSTGQMDELSRLASLFERTKRRCSLFPLTAGIIEYFVHITLSVNT
jgi:hypothetical protein